MMQKDVTKTTAGQVKATKRPRPRIISKKSHIKHFFQLSNALDNSAYFPIRLGEKVRIILQKESLVGKIKKFNLKSNTIVLENTFDFATNFEYSFDQVILTKQILNIIPINDKDIENLADNTMANQSIKEKFKTSRTYIPATIVMDNEITQNECQNDMNSSHSEIDNSKFDEHKIIDTGSNMRSLERYSKLLRSKANKKRNEKLKVISETKPKEMNEDDENSSSLNSSNVSIKDEKHKNSNNDNKKDFKKTKVFKPKVAEKKNGNFVVIDGNNQLELCSSYQLKPTNSINKNENNKRKVLKQNDAKNINGKHDENKQIKSFPSHRYKPPNDINETKVLKQNFTEKINGKIDLIDKNIQFKPANDINFEINETNLLKQNVSEKINGKLDLTDKNTQFKSTNDIIKNDIKETKVLKQNVSEKINGKIDLIDKSNQLNVCKSDEFKPTNGIINNNNNIGSDDFTGPPFEFDQNKAKEILKLTQNLVYLTQFDRTYYDAIADINTQNIISLLSEPDKCGRHSRISLLTIGTRYKIYIFDILFMGKILDDLKNILESKKIKKIIHFSPHIFDQLSKLHGIHLCAIFDTYAAFTMFSKPRQQPLDLVDIIHKTMGVQYAYFTSDKDSYNIMNTYKRPLRESILSIVAKKAAFQLQLYYYFLHECMLKNFYTECDKFSKKYDHCGIVDAVTKMSEDFGLFGMKVSKLN